MYAENWGDFDPIPEINQTNGDADLALLALSANDIAFVQPVTDPWYMATTKEDGDGEITVPLYLPDRPASFVGCKVQHQWCDPNVNGANGCTKLAGFTQVANEAASLFQRPRQNASFYAMTWALNVSPSIEAIIDRLGTTALTSRYTLNAGIQGPLPSNQWQSDVEHLHATTLAALQRMTIEQATGPTDQNLQRFFIRPNDDMEREARCQQVRHIIQTAVQR